MVDTLDRELSETNQIQQRLHHSQKSIFSRQFSIMWIANFCFLTSQSSFFLFPLFITQRNGTKADIGILMAALSLSAILIRPWVSEMVDRFGRKRSYLLGSAIMAVLPVFYLLFDGTISEIYIPLFAVRLIHGMGVALGFTASITYVADIIPSHRMNEGLGIFGVAALVGLAAGPAISEPIIRNFGFNTFFLTAAAFGMFSTLMVLFVDDSYSQSPGQKAVGSFFKVLGKKNVWWGAVMSVFMGIGGGTQGAFVTPYTQHLGLVGISLYFVAYSAAAVLVRIFGSRVTDRFGENKIIPWAFAVFGIGFLSLLAVTSIWMLVMSGFVTGIGHGFLFPGLNALMIRDQPSEIRGKVSGAFSGGMDSGIFLGSITLGYLGEYFGFRSIFLTTFLAMMLAIVLFYRSFSKPELNES